LTVNDHWQHLGRRADGHRDGKEQRFEPIALGQAVDQEHRRSHYHHETDHQPDEAVDPLFEARLRPLADDHLGHVTKTGLASGEYGHPRCRAADDARPHEAEVGQLQRVLGTLRHGARPLLRR
jgi:hypothetical protein